MSFVRRVHRYTYADYVALELGSPTKHEFLDGEIHAMAGVSEEHSALAAQVVHGRTADGTWIARVAIDGGRVQLPSLGCELVVDEVYRGSSIGR